MNTAVPPPVAQLLRDAGLFGDLDDVQLAELARQATVEDYSAGVTLFREGSRNDKLCFVIVGAVALEMHIPRRGPTRLLTIGAGQLLAWSALLGDGTMTATGIVQEDLRMIAFPADALRTLCESNHDIGYSVMKHVSNSISRRLLGTRLQLLDLFAESDAPLLPTEGA